MANEEHLEILKQGVEVWNRWREENPRIKPDLTRTKLSDTNLDGGRKAEMPQADFEDMNFSRTLFDGAILRGANFRNSNLSFVSLREADLRRANLDGANLYQAQLNLTNLTLANLNKANLDDALFWETILARVNLNGAQGLELCRHGGPSIIDHRTLQKSGVLPQIFLRGCGLLDWEIEAAKLNQKNLTQDQITNIIYEIHRLRSKDPIQFFSCFISHSKRDEKFAKRFYSDLQNNGVRCWFAPEDMRIGDKIRNRIDESIRLHDKLLLILSGHSINSTWVEKEVETAFEEECKRNQIVLFPIRLDETVMETNQAWAADIRRTRHIGDFSRWEDHDAYQQAFERLLRDLKAEG